MAKGQVTSRELVEQYLIRIATLRGSPERGAGRQPARARGGRRARSRARAGQAARPAARHPGRAQGQHPHHRHADHRRRAGVRGLRAAVRSDADEEPARRRRDHHRQDRADRAGQLGGRQAQRRCRATTTPSAASPSTRTTRGPIRGAEPGDGRPVLQTGGSSSGIGTAANFWAASVGTDTGGSIISPSNANMLVGIRPTIGRISRYGVIPITADHDTAGPDDAHRGRRRDHARRAGRARRPIRTMRRRGPARRRRTATTRSSSNAGGLKGARIGMPRAFYYRPRDAAGREDARAAASTPNRRR